MGARFIGITSLLFIVAAIFATLSILGGKGIQNSKVGAQMTLLAALWAALATAPYLWRAEVHLDAHAIVQGLAVIALTITFWRSPTPESKMPLKLLHLTVLGASIAGAVAMTESLLGTLMHSNQSVVGQLLNAISGGPAWKDPGFIGRVARGSAFAREPSFLAQGLVPMTPIIMGRFGLLGPRTRSVCRPVATKTQCAFMTAGLASSMSIVGLFGATVAASTCALLLAHKTQLPTALRRTGLGVGVAALLASLNPAIRAKVQPGLALFAGAPGTYRSVEATSAATIALNKDVTIKVLGQHPILGGGLGSHDHSYATYLQAADLTSPAFLAAHGLNVHDASGLLLRLLSESGLVGTTVFLSLLAVPLINLFGRVGSSPRIALLWLSGTIGAIAISLARNGDYHNVAVWWPLLLTSFLANMNITETDGHA